MQLPIKQLNSHLNTALSALYLISSDVPLLIQDARDTILKMAKSKGFSEKNSVHCDTLFRTEILEDFIYNDSLFCDKKILDLRNLSAQFESSITMTLQHYLSQPRNDHLVIISTNKLSSAQQKTAWFDLIKKQAVYLPIWPVSFSELPPWILDRNKKFQTILSLDHAKFLAVFCEGNLLAIEQALEKLDLLYPNETITREQLTTVITDHARFDIFDLSDAIAKHNSKKIIRIVKRLQQTGEEPVLVLWSIARQLREQNNAQKNGLLQMAAHVDEMIKGAKIGDAWQALLQLSLSI